ncbi:hypothetical protein [Veillonella criceti]|uniref:Uncharacterized protein n=1 Tax=Veillonella criceti TaxID=103891 RepID=A0A380NJI8_9FIRM|nr:hypothetical protein [Veillonella criceti]SUP41878.1 Uncharacterised protein [Veillonella criceti]
MLAELLISSTIICIVLLALLSLIGTSVKWWQQWQISNEVYLEATTTRLTIANYTKQSPKKMTVGQTGTYLLQDGFRQYGITGGEASRILSDGQAQAISATSLSPRWGDLIVAPIRGTTPFSQLGATGPIHMQWRTYVDGRANTINGSTYEQLTDVTIYPNTLYFGYSKDGKNI